MTTQIDKAPVQLRPPVNALSVDVEEHFHAQALGIGRSQWDDIPSRVAASTHRVLDLFAGSKAKGTFFVLGWVAERHPGLIRRIVAEGHELASHGWCHERVDGQTPEQFRADIRLSKAVLEDIGRVGVQGYRAATFSIGRTTPWAFEILAEEGFTYSSSLYPVRHDLYGMPEAPRFSFRPLPGRRFNEFPLSTLEIGGRNLPISGGGYFRLLPYPVSRWAMRRINRLDRQPCIFYFHPWELDPGQPRVPGLPAKSRIRHYLNLDAMESRLRRLLADFRWDRMDHVFAPVPVA